MEAEEIITRWRTGEEAVRARLGASGVASVDEVASKSGMEVFEAIFAGALPQPPIGDSLDFAPIHMAPGEAVFQERPQRCHYNPLGTVRCMAAGSRRYSIPQSAARSMPRCLRVKASPRSN